MLYPKASTHKTKLSSFKAHALLTRVLRTRKSDKVYSTAGIQALFKKVIFVRFDQCC